MLFQVTITEITHDRDDCIIHATITPPGDHPPVEWQRAYPASQLTVQMVRANIREFIEARLQALQMTADLQQYVGFEYDIEVP